MEIEFLHIIVKQQFLKRILYSCFIVVTFFSCNRYNIEQDIKKMQAVEFALPYDMFITLSDSGSNVQLDRKSDYKWVVYFDSTYCKPCLVKNLAMNWKEFIREMSRKKIDIECVFVFSAQASDTLAFRNAMKVNDFDYPICLDTSSVVARLNPQIPDNPIFHTFLIDCSNNVVIVGDPTSSKRIMNIFYNIVSDKKSLAQKQHKVKRMSM